VKRFRNIVIGACAAMVLALSVGASAASAAGFYTDSSAGITQVTGTQVAPNSEFAFPSGGFQCWNQNFSGAPLDDPGTTLSPTSMNDGECSYAGTQFVMHMNGCRTIYHANGTMDIGPAGCGPISLKTPYSCEMTIPAQTGLGGVSYENVENKRVKIKQSVTGLKYTEKGKCKEGTYTDGSWYGNWEAYATDGGVVTGLHFGPVPTGIFVSSEYKLDAEGFPVSLSGSQTSGSPITLGTTYGSVKCPNGTFSGEPSAASAEVSLQADYSSGCAANGISGATMVMNGCTYVAHIAGSGPPYTGTADIACPAGKAIEIVAKILGETKCTLTIGAQSGLSGLTFTNAGSGSGRKVELGFNLSAIHYHQQEGTGFGRCTTGDYENGTYKGNLSLTGIRFP